MSKQNESIQIIDLAADQLLIAAFLARRTDFCRLTGDLMRIRLQRDVMLSRSKVDQELEYI